MHPFERSVARFLEAVEGRRPGSRLLRAARCSGHARDGARVRALASRRGALRRARGGARRLTMAGTTGLDAFFVPAAHTLPSNAAYLAHLAAAADDPSLIRLASNENTEPPSPRVRAALEDGIPRCEPLPSSDAAAAARARRAARRRAVPGARHGGLDGGDRRALPHVRSATGSEAVIPASVVACLPTPARQPSRRASSRSRCGARPTASATTWTTFVAALSAETRLIVVCSPNNPTGNAMETADIRRLADTGIPLLLDAAYADFDPGARPDAARARVRQRDRDANVLEGVLPRRRQGRLRGRRRRGARSRRPLPRPRQLHRHRRRCTRGSLRSRTRSTTTTRWRGSREERERLLPRLRELGLRGVPVCGELRRGRLRRAPGRRGRRSRGRCSRTASSCDRSARWSGSASGAPARTTRSSTRWHRRSVRGRGVIPDGVRSRDLVGYGRNPPGVRLAGRRHGRRQPRAGLRGGLRGLGALGRRLQRGLGRVRGPGRAAAAAGPRHGGALRVRQPGRRLAPGAHLRRGAGAGDGVRGGGGARAEPGGARLDAGARPRPARPRLALDPALGHVARGGARAPPSRRSRPTSACSASDRTAGTARRGRASRRASCSSRKAASSTTRTGAPTTFPTTRPSPASRFSSCPTRRRTTTAASS